jgi:hypothetical protein
MYRVLCTVFYVPCTVFYVPCVSGIILETISRSGEAGSKEVPLLHLTADTDVEVLVNQVKEEGRKEGRKEERRDGRLVCGAVSCDADSPSIPFSPTFPSAYAIKPIKPRLCSKSR